MILPGLENVMLGGRGSHHVPSEKEESYLSKGNLVIPAFSLYLEMFLTSRPLNIAGCRWTEERAL